MKLDNTSEYEKVLSLDPSANLLNQRFWIQDPEAFKTARSFGEATSEALDLDYMTLIEIHYTVNGFFGTFRELAPSNPYRGFPLDSLILEGFSFRCLLTKDSRFRFTRARFAMLEWRPEGFHRRLHSVVKLRSDFEIAVYDFDPILLKHPPKILS